MRRAIQSVASTSSSSIARRTARPASGVPRRARPSTASFSSSSRTYDAAQQQESSTSSSSSSSSTGDNKQQQKKQSKAKDEGPTTAPGKSPFSVFVDTLREEIQKSRELQENVKQLQGEGRAAMDSEAAKRMRAAYEKARVSSPSRN